MNRIFSLCTLLVGFALAPEAQAEWIDRKGVALPESAFRKSEGDFSAWLVQVPDDRELYEAWSLPAEVVEIREADRVLVDSPISVFVVFGGCALDPSGNCQVDVRFRVLAPDGSVYSRTPPMEVWVAKPAPASGLLELSVGYLKIVVESHEQLGRYRVQAKVRDHVAGKELGLEKSFEALPLGAVL